MHCWQTWTSEVKLECADSEKGGIYLKLFGLARVSGINATSNEALLMKEGKGTRGLHNEHHIQFHAWVGLATRSTQMTN